MSRALVRLGQSEGGLHGQDLAGARVIQLFVA